MELHGCDSIGSLLTTSGFVNKLLTLANREKAVQDILIYYVLRIRMAEIYEIRRGLDSVGLSSFLKCHPSFVSKAFSQSKDVTVESDNLLSKINIEMTPDTLNNKQRDAIDWFRKFIHQLPPKAQTGIVFIIHTFVVHLFL